jgi:DNA topoisomerase I
VPSRPDYEDVAEAAGVRYVHDDAPGWRRIRRGKGFSYVDLEGEPLGPAAREWIRSLAIPPAWTDVWISPHRNGHILATGHDQAGRKQYLYHPRWEEASAEVKFDRMAPFGRRLPTLRRGVDAELRRPGLGRRKVVAVALAVLDETLIRVGNRRYTEAHASYGLTTIEPDQVDVTGTLIRLQFAGKSGADHELAFRDRRLADLLARCQELDGQTLFSYRNEDGLDAVTSTDVNVLVSELTGDDFTAKDFRTWGATATVAEALVEHAAATDEAVLAAIDRAAERLGNTRAVCRESYVHPRVIEAFDDGTLAAAWRRSRTGRWMSRAESTVRTVLDGG